MTPRISALQNYQKLFRPMPGAGEKSEGRKIRLSACQSIAETYVLDLMNSIKPLDLIDFKNFTTAENQAFKTEFTRTVR